MSSDFDWTLNCYECRIIFENFDDLVLHRANAHRRTSRKWRNRGIINEIRRKR